MKNKNAAVYSRRRMFGMAGGALGASLLAGCQISTETDPTGGGGQAESVALKIPDSGAKIPKGDIQFQWMDSGDLKALFERPVFEAYQKKYPNVTIDYQDSPWEKINEAIPLAVRNNSAPDVFALPENVPVATAINEGWIQPIDDLVPDFEKWKSTFPAGIFLEGIHVFDGKTYTFPSTASKRLSHLLMFDPEYMKQADLDPIAERFTWESFRDACKKLTKQGNGDYYALLAHNGQFAGLPLTLARLAGMRSVGEEHPMDMQTGEYNASAPELVAAFELLLAIKSDGSFFPGFMGLADAEGRARMPQRVAAMLFDGPWDIPEWRTTNPDYKFDIAMPPMGDDGQPHYLSYVETGSTTNFAYVSADTKNAAVAGDLFSYMGSVEGQTQLVLLSEGNLTSVIPAANEAAEKERDRLDPLALKAIGIADELMRIAPQVQARNGDASQVLLEFEAVTPTLLEIGQGILTGEITNIEAELKKFDDQAEQNLEKAIEAARKKGAQITRDDYAFPNWDPTKDYAKSDYEALPK